MIAPVYKIGKLRIVLSHPTNLLPIMLWKSKADFKHTGIVSLVAGFLIVLFGDWSGMGSYNNIAYSYYEGGLYWAIVVQSIGIALMVTGMIILIVNKLRDD